MSEAPGLQRLPLAAREALAAMSQADWFAHGWTGEPLLTFLSRYGVSPVDFFRAEGYWREAETAPSSLPFPHRDAWDASQAQPFLGELAFVEAELERRQLRMQLMGHSKCRLCGCLNGTAEFFLQGWKWPSGLRHYVEAHQVAPSADFQTFVAHAAARLR